MNTPRKKHFARTRSLPSGGKSEPSKAVAKTVKTKAAGRHTFSAGRMAQPPAVGMPSSQAPKLQKVLAQAGLGGRLQVEQWIAGGRVEVNGQKAHIGQRVQQGDYIKVNGQPVRVRIAPQSPRVLAYHKPAGEIVTHNDPNNRPTVFGRLPPLPRGQGKWQSVGRLDLNTEGLLLLTSCGELANRLMHPRFGLEREYAVRVLGALTHEEKQRLLQGIKLSDGMAAFSALEDGGGEGANCWYRVTIAEGRNREVRRMFEVLGRAVSRLIRIRYGAMLLPRGLARGAWVELDEHDIHALMHAAGTVSDGATGRDITGRGGRAKPATARDSIPSKTPGKGRVGQRHALFTENAPSPSKPPANAAGYIGADSLSRQRKQQRQRGFETRRKKPS